MDKTVKVMILSVVVAVIFVGGGIGAMVINNNMAADREAKAQELKRKERQEAEQKSQAAELVQQGVINGCLQRAEDAYWSYVKLNATSTKQTADGPVYYASQATWDYAETSRKNAKDDCYRN